MNTQREPAPTDNDAWNSLLVTNSQLGKKVAELERELSIMSKSRDIVSDYQDELEAKLQKAEARLKQLEWVPYSERKPTLEDADDCGYVVIANRTREWQTPWNLHPETASHWRPFAPPIIDNDEVDFENWYRKNGSSYIGVKKGNMRKIWKAAREVKQ